MARTGLQRGAECAEHGDGVVVARSGDGRVYGLNAADGTRQWEYIARRRLLLIRTSAGVTIDKSVVVCRPTRAAR